MNAEKLVTEWEKHWQREGRLEGGLDRFAKADLIERITAATAEQPKKKGAR